MRRYETTIIVHPSISQEERQAFFEKVTGLLATRNGILIRFDEWGQRRLAYEIKKETRGYYGFLEYCGDGALVKELERNIRLDDRSLKYMTICTDPEVDKAAVEAEIEAMKAKAAEAEREKEEKAALAETAAAEAAAKAAAADPPAEDVPEAPETEESSEKEETPDGSV